MLDRKSELEAFKRDINLVDYALAQGYALDQQASSRHSAVLAHSDGDKIVVARGADGHWTFFSVRDDRDNGSIVDFVQRRHGGTLGDVRKRLRPFLEDSPPLPRSVGPVLEIAVKDPARVRASFEAMRLIDGKHDYLERTRFIPAEVLAHARFSGRIRVDERGNVIFPHWNLSGLSGYELKNRGFTGFAPGGEKGLWSSNLAENDRTLVIAESAIDALSHFALRRPENTRYVSTAGSFNPIQPELIRRAAEKLGAGARVILATDNDEGGDDITLTIRGILAPVDGLEILEDRPPQRGMDWNDVLRSMATIEPQTPLP
jgi:Toprim-like/Protein of unknown function (DUF3991)